MKTNTGKKTVRNVNKPGSKAEFIGALFQLLDEAEGSGVPFRVDFDADEDDTITISLGVKNIRLTRAAAKMGFVVTRQEPMASNIYRAAEAYLVCEEPHAVFAIKAWMHYQGAEAGADGRMAVEYLPDTPADGLAINN